MEFNSQSYRQAALEHLDAAQGLHGSEQYFLAHYLAGLAVECMLRAYLVRISRQFDSRHDLRELARESRFFDIVPLELHELFGSRFSTLNERWRSNHRFASQQQLWKYLRDIKADRGLKGDPQKNHSRTAVNTALEIVSFGEKKWKLSNT